MKKGWLGLLLSLSLAVWAGEDLILAEIDGQKVLASQVRAYVKTRPLLAGYLAIGYPGWRTVLIDLIDLELLNREGERLAIPRGPEDDEDLYALRVKRHLLPACPKPDEAGAKRFYLAHPELFSTPAFVRLERLELAASTQVEGQEARAFLTEAAARVRAGQGSFEDLAKACPQESVCLQDLGFVRTDGLTELGDASLKALQTVKVGEVIGPVQVGDRWYLYHVTARREPILARWKAVKAEAAEQAQAHCRREAFTQLREELYRRYRVVLYEEALKSL